jgi:hypothetical protein
MIDTGRVSILIKYTIAGVVLVKLVQGLGAGAPVMIMTACVGPPLLHFGWVLFQRGRG